MSGLRPERADDGKPRCGAQKRQGAPGETCSFVAGWGTDHVGFGHCRLHGGNTRTQRLGARAEKADSEARRALAQMEVAAVGDPFAALSRLAGQVLAWQEAIGGIVNQLGDRIRYEGASGSEQLRAEIALVSALEAALAAAGVTGRAADDARKAAARHLRAV